MVSNLTKRIETLEKSKGGTVAFILCEVGESAEEAKRRYFQERNMRESDLRACFIIEGRTTRQG